VAARPHSWHCARPASGSGSTSGLLLPGPGALASSQLGRWHRRRNAPDYAVAVLSKAAGTRSEAVGGRR
jgi:hypothetical protein